jgi:putative chitinase
VNFTQEKLQQFLPKNQYISYWYSALEKLLPDYNIDNPQRLANFLGQCYHESGGFVFIKENLNYRWQSLRKVFAKYFPTDQLAQQYEKQPQKIANRVYASRMGNGPEESGDGWRFCGRGLIQVTGRDNYSWFAASLQITPEEASEYMETFEGAAQSACWFWETNNLNKFVDANDIRGLTRAINGGYNGLDDRIKHTQHALEIFN